MEQEPVKATAGAAARGTRRRHRRFRTHSLLVDHPVTGKVVNVGQRGLAVETPEKLFVGGSYVFKVRLGAKQLKLSGKIQWCRLVGTKPITTEEAGPVFQAGVAFEETVASRAWQEALRRLTEKPSYVVWHSKRPRPSTGHG